MFFILNIYFQTDVDDFVMTWGHRTAKYFSQIEKQLTPYIERYRYILMDILMNYNVSFEKRILNKINYNSSTW